MAIHDTEMKSSQGGLFGKLRTSISAKLVVTMVLLAVIPLAVAWFLLNRSSSSELLAQTGRSNQEVALRTADLTTQTLIENLHLLETLTVSDAVRARLEQANNSYTGSEKDITEKIILFDRAWVGTPASMTMQNPVITNVIQDSLSTGLLKNFKQWFPAHVELSLTDKRGANVAATSLTQDYYQGDETWWQEAYKNGDGTIFISRPSYDKKTGMMTLLLAVPVKGQSNEVIGILSSVFDVRAITEALGAIKLGRSGRLAIADSDGTIIFDPVKQPDLDQRLPGKMLSTGMVKSSAPGWTQTVAFGGEDSVVGYAKPPRTFGIPAIENLQWTTVASTPSSEALAPIASSLGNQLILGAIVTVLAVVFALFLSGRLTGQIRHILDLFKEIRVGNYKARAPVTTDDELGQMTNDLNTMLNETLVLIQSREERESLQRSIMKLLDEVSGLAEGDLTVEAEVNPDITGAMADAFNYMTAELRQIISRVQDVTLQVNSSASATRQTTEQIAQESEAQARQILEARESIEEMTSSMQKVSETANLSASVAERSLQAARRGSEAVQNTVVGMNSIRDQVQETAKRIKRLGEHSQEIGEMVRLIGDIAYRTSVLALNTSIQAARAGEAGRGFAVVAEEVERLAKRATESTKRISELVKTIQVGTSEAIAAMEESTREVVEGSRLANQAGEALSQIENVSSRLAELIQSISVSAATQARGSEEVSKTMMEISQFTQHTAFSIKESALSVNNLASLANELRSSVASFKVSQNYASN
ncbi:MAG TPA: methyl-accepting chemotaxis protein [Blastocatellia bacterium]|jgi:methyl-accepting chemotaxis protein